MIIHPNLMVNSLILLVTRTNFKDVNYVDAVNTSKNIKSKFYPS